MNAVYIYYTPSWQPLVDIVLPVLKDYCRKHKFVLINHDHEGNNEDWAFHKMNKLLKFVEWTQQTELNIWVLDVDTLITNPNISFKWFIDYEHDIFITRDINGINAGSWIMRNTEASKQFLQAIVDNFDEPHEQILMNKFLHMVNVKYLPHPSINSYRYELYKDVVDNALSMTHDQGQWEPGDLLLHLPGLTLEKRIEVLQEMI